MKEKVGTIKGTSWGTMILIIPSAVATDSAFPFEPNEKVKVRIEEQSLVIQKV